MVKKSQDRQFNIIKISSKIRDIWLKHPSLTFGKMITCVIAEAGKGREPMDITDEELVFVLNKELKRKNARY